MLKKFQFLKNGIGIEGQKVPKQVRDQTITEANKDGAQVIKKHLLSLFWLLAITLA